MENPTEVEKYKNGDEKLLNFLLGQVMRHTHGKANPESTADLLKKELAS